MRLQAVGKRYGVRQPWVVRDVSAEVPGGRLIGSYLVADGIPSCDELSELLAPFRVEAVRYAARAGHGWSLSPNPDSAAELVLFEATAG